MASYLLPLVVEQIRDRGLDYNDVTIVRQLDRVRSSFNDLPTNVQEHVAHEIVRLATRRMESRPGFRKRLSGGDIEYAGRQIGEKMRNDRSEFSGLPDAQQLTMLKSCPWCGE